MKVQAFSFASLMAAAALLLASCGRGHSLSDILDEYVSDSDGIVLVADMQRAVTATGSHIENGRPVLSPTIGDILDNLPSGARRAVAAVVDCEGLDWQHIVVAADADAPAFDAVVVVPLTDRGRFMESLAANGTFSAPEKVDGWLASESASVAVIARDDLAFLVASMSGPVGAARAVEIVEARMKAASSAPLAAWKKDRLDCGKVLAGVVSGKVCAMALPLLVPGGLPVPLGAVSVASGAMGAGSVGFTADFDGPSFKVAVDCFDSEGKLVAVPASKTVDGSLARFACPSAQLALAVGDARALFSACAPLLGLATASDPALQRVVSDVLTAADGTLFLSCGVRDQWDLADLDIDDISFSLALQFPEGAAPKALDALAGAFRASGLYRFDHTPGAGFAASILMGYRTDTADSFFSIYDDDETEPEPELLDITGRVCDGGVLVISNTDVTAGASPFSPADFAGDAVALRAVCRRDGPLFSSLSLPFGVTLQCSLRGSQSALDITLTDTDRPFLVALAELLGSKLAHGND